jgi:DNA repair protein RecN (Recombination protein N)
MIRYLRIRDFALIRELNIEFHPGLTLLTGETGSGKSILVDALGLLLGERASLEMIRSHCESALVEGFWTIDRGSRIDELLQGAGIDRDDEGLLVRREITGGGRGRVFINNCLSTQGFLKGIGEHLADIHGQHDRESLLDTATHLGWIDRYGANLERVKVVRERFHQMKEIALRLEALQMDEQERLRRIDVLDFQVKEIAKANPKPMERESNEIEKNILAHRERIFALSSEAYGLIYESETSVLTEARRVQKILQELESFDGAWTPHRESLREILYRLEDISYALRDYTSGIDFSPERLDQVQQRLSDLERLSQKYGASCEEILAYAEKCRLELESLLSYADTSQSLQVQLESMTSSYLEAAEKLSDKRRADAGKLERALQKEFQALALDKMELSVRFAPRGVEPKAVRLPTDYGPDGLDRVQFLIAPNKGEEMRPLSKIASGGELSRVMLAIRSLCGTGEAGKTLVFDEIDSGIGGRVAEAVGRRLLDLGRINQVMCVTHLPQIAAFAQHHYAVRKFSDGGRTETDARVLAESDRMEEIARMLGGELITDAARRHASEMLNYSTGKK